ncbi:MAG: AlpA family phage regulatory protein [Pseudomonadota bacterium]
MLAEECRSTPLPALERKPSVLARTGLSDSLLYRLIIQGKFPRPVPLGTGRAVAWVTSEVDAFINARIAERDANLMEAA